jgi:CBS domain-containing protein
MISVRGDAEMSRAGRFLTPLSGVRTKEAAMQIHEVMTRRAECTRPESTLQEAAEQMKSLDVGSLPVCEHNHLVGVLTDRDIVVRSLADGHDPRHDSVRDAKTPHVFFCYEDQDVTDAARLMRDKQVRRLPVLDRHERLVGIVSLGDLAVDTDMQLAGRALEGVSEPSSPKR